ncbi:MAG: creatininase [Cenarchaeum symbiont of Oopsacas minuta]|nr:creatininase [Cenarchaeum symbiont of Oopsacas minuta]
MEKGSYQKMIQMSNVKDGFDPELRNAIIKKHTAVIPIGSIEQHGAHLPVSTDADLAYKVSKKLCSKTGYLLLPVIQYGVSREHAPLFNLSLRPATLRSLVCDLVKSSAELGIRTIFVINGHHGNQAALKGVEKMAEKACKGKVKTFVFSYWKFMSEGFDHAGHIETSLMLAVSKNTRMSRAIKGFEEPKGAKLKEATRLASKSFVSVTKNGIWGDPRSATASDGKRMLATIVKNLEKKCRMCINDTA